MARAKKWLRLNEDIKSIDDWNERVKPMLDDLILGQNLSTKGVYDKYWFCTVLSMRRVSGSLSFVTDNYDDIDSSVIRLLSKHSQPMKLRVTINLEEWRKFLEVRESD